MRQNFMFHLSLKLHNWIWRNVQTRFYLDYVHSANYYDATILLMRLWIICLLGYFFPTCSIGRCSFLLFDEWKDVVMCPVKNAVALPDSARCESVAHFFSHRLLCDKWCTDWLCSNPAWIFFFPPNSHVFLHCHMQIPVTEAVSTISLIRQLCDVLHHTHNLFNSRSWTVTGTDRAHKQQQQQHKLRWLVNRAH